MLLMSQCKLFRFTVLLQMMMGYERRNFVCINKKYMQNLTRYSLYTSFLSNSNFLSPERKSTKFIRRDVVDVVEVKAVVVLGKVLSVGCSKNIRWTPHVVIVRKEIVKFFPKKLWKTLRVNPGVFPPLIAKVFLGSTFR